MKSLLPLWICALGLATLPACSWWHSHPSAKKPDQPAPAAPKLIGRVASIPADKRFVLIQRYGTGKIEVGTVLTTRGPDERTANLLVTGESLGQFTAADVQSGLLDIGDAVYSRHVPTPATPPTAAETPE
ncbi:MAG: hypothetical protein WCJ14_14190, partial [Verrucomicrobiota bacterium]